MKKNMILLTALSLFLHMPLFSIPIGACFLEKDGKRIDIWGANILTRLNKHAMPTIGIALQAVV